MGCALFRFCISDRIEKNQDRLSVVSKNMTELQIIVTEADAVHVYRPNPISVSYDASRKRVDLVYADGSEHCFPVENVEAIARLPHRPTDAELSAVSLTGGGWTIRWAALDVHLPVDDIQECIYGSQRWMRQLLEANR
jgi:Protein of unknown function (DUF2442)